MTADILDGEGLAELKPCPFCGGDGAFAGSTLDNSYYVVCGNESCSGMVGYFEFEAGAVTAWNRRPPAAIPTTEGA